MSNKVIFNADDFGISLGVNAAIKKAYDEGILNAASLMVNQKYALEALKLAKKMPDLDLGLHVNLTNEYSTLGHSKLPLLTDQNGKFKNGFVKLLLLAVFKPKKLRAEVSAETEAQIMKAKKMGAKLTHIDSHRHVHMIPLIFKVLLELQEKYGIERIRVMNECALMTMKTNKSKAYLFDGGLIKYFLLRFLAVLNGYSSKTYFYTILYTCKLSKEHFKKVLIPDGFENVEVMIHPSVTSIDQAHKEDIFDENILSDWRNKELETLMDKTLPAHFVFGAKYPFFINLYLKIEKFWFSKIPEKLRFLLVGGFNTVFSYAFYAFLLEIVGLPYLLSLVIQWFVTVNLSIATMRYYVFQSKGDIIAEFMKAWSVYIFLFFANVAGLSFLIEICKINPLWAQGIYLTFSTILTYILHKYFSFRKNSGKTKESDKQIMN
ncbi:MAG: ChbG/HpnK family deacetylase [Alphaproteobacteria bacterium]|nr:ChbG/HpnK family deacetylase [Alphaproteobacteria bacterium]